jgi:hypothetical protein
MKRLALALAVTAGLLLVPAAAVAQYRYTDDKGVTRSTQYKVDIPATYRDAAEWVGPTGIGKPALSEEARQTRQRDDAYRRLGEANRQLVPYQGAATPDLKRSVRSKSGRYKANRTRDELESKEMATMCIAGEQRVMKSPGHWAVVGPCHSTPGTTNSVPILAPR